MDGRFRILSKGDSNDVRSQCLNEPERAALSVTPSKWRRDAKEGGKGGGGRGAGAVVSIQINLIRRPTTAQRQRPALNVQNQKAAARLRESRFIAPPSSGGQVHATHHMFFCLVHIVST